LCLGGRVGTANNPTISSDIDGIITGSGTASKNLLIHSNPSLDGYTEFDGQLRIKAGTPFGVGSQVIGESAGGALQILGLSPSTATSVVGGGLRAIALDPDSIATPILVQDSTYASLIIPGQIHLASPGGNAFIFAIIAGATIMITDSTNKLKVGLFSDNNTIVADGTTQTLDEQVSFESEPVLQSNNGGVLTINDSKVVWDNFSLATDGTPGGSVTVIDHAVAISAPTIGDFCVITNRRGLWFKDYFDSGGIVVRGTATNQIAVDVEDLPPHPVNPGVLMLSLRSVGAGVQMRHVGAAVFGANAAPTGAYILEVIGNAHISGKLTVDGAIDPTDITYSSQLISTIVTGTAPMVVASTTGVTNLNADMVDGLHATAFASAATLIPLSAQSNDIVDTTVTGTAGFYRVHVYLVDSTAALAAGTVSCNIKFNDGSAAQTITVGPIALATLGSMTQATIFVNLASGNLTYGTVHTGSFLGSQYGLFITWEKVA
jgi:hypothetical protein